MNTSCLHPSLNVPCRVLTLLPLGKVPGQPAWWRGGGGGVRANPFHTNSSLLGAGLWLELILPPCSAGECPREVTSYVKKTPVSSRAGVHMRAHTCVHVPVCTIHMTCRY